MIGILGGTFDPIHYGHLRTALDVQETLQLSEVRFIPCGDPPHRNMPVASGLQRLAMVSAAIQGQAGFVVDDRELQRPGASYMVDTLASLKADFPQQSLCLMIGMDAFHGLESWHHWQQLFDYAHLVVMQRPGRKLKENDLGAGLQQLCEQNQVTVGQLANYPQGKLCFVDVTQLDISATDIRQRWQQGQQIRYLLPDQVLQVIQQQHIYG